MGLVVEIMFIFWGGNVVAPYMVPFMLWMFFEYLMM